MNIYIISYIWPFKRWSMYCCGVAECAIRREINWSGASSCSTARIQRKEQFHLFFIFLLFFSWHGHDTFFLNLPYWISVTRIHTGSRIPCTLYSLFLMGPRIFSPPTQLVSSTQLAERLNWPEMNGFQQLSEWIPVADDGKFSQKKGRKKFSQRVKGKNMFFVISCIFSFCVNYRVCLSRLKTL